MGFIENFKAYKKRIIGFKGNVNDMTEEATKNALVMPFFSAMGYDVFNPSEFLPEFVCDVGTKKGEKVDYAIMRDNEPIVLIEVKRAGMKLQKTHYSQLFRYFSVNRARIAILTNGIQYNFYSDFETPNVLDEEPFFTFNVFDDDENLYIQSLEQFTNDNFDIKNIISKAVYLKYAKIVEKLFLKDLEQPSDELVKYFLTRSEIKSKSRITAHMIEQYREITAKTIRKLMGVTLSVTSKPVPSVDSAVIKEVVSECISPVEKTISEKVEIVSSPIVQPQSPSISKAISTNYCICCKRQGKYLKINKDGFCPMCEDTATEEQKQKAKQEAQML